MKLVCPECGAVGSAAHFTGDAEARSAMATLATLPTPVIAPTVAYLGLFRPAKRVLGWRRAHALIVELAELMASPALHRRGRDWPVTPELWRQALEQMLSQREKIQTPLKSHGYLLTIVAGLASRAEATAEEKHEAELRSGFRAGHGADQRSYQQLLIRSENEARKRFGQFKMTPREEEAFLARAQAQEHRAHG